MANEMIEEGKLLKMIHSVLHDSLLATTTGDQKQSKRSSESQSQGDIKRQRTYEPENEITKPPDFTDLHHQQQKSPDTENTETPQGDNPDIGNRGAASLTAIEEAKNVLASAEFWAVMQTTHGLQNRAASANEVTPKTEPGTTSRQQTEAFLENQRNPKRRRGSDGEYTEPTTTTALLGDIDTLKDTPTSRPDTKRCIQVGRETYAVTSQPGTPYTFDPRTDTGTTLGQRPQSVENAPALGIPQVHKPQTVVYVPQHTSTVEGHRRKKNKTGSKQKRSMTQSKALAGAWRQH
jgi:hypothetical protein